ncbi:MAG TPA: ATP-binding protein [Phototrophicaceae bacterium]|nr:ATP-binding protein [Phototrophicaceae bacterium]
MEQNDLFPGAALKTERMPGHWLLVRLGKRVLRPGGMGLTQLIDRLQVMARLDSATHLIVQRIDVNRLVAEFCTKLRYDAKEKGIEVLSSLEAGRLLAEGDARELDLALTELGKNAVWFTPSKGSITITTRREENQAVIEVQDTGIGIPTAEFSNIFQRLYRIDQARSTHLGGSGLGLSIARRIVELHHGAITVESILGEGSTFKILLPLADSE